MLRIDDLENKSVLVTGASAGIGAAVSLAFARQGARVAVHWHSNRAAADALVEDICRAGGTAVEVHNLSRHLAREFASRNIRVNTVSPGFLDTSLHSATPPEHM